MTKTILLLDQFIDLYNIVILSLDILKNVPIGPDFRSYISEFYAQYGDKVNSTAFSDDVVLTQVMELTVRD